MKNKKTGLNIELFDGWKLRSDSCNIILEQDDRQFYYSSLSGALESLIEKKIKGFDCSNLPELINSIKTLSQTLNKLIEPLNLRVVPK